MGITLSEISDAFRLPRPDWDAIRTWVDQRVPGPEHRDAWNDIAIKWLAVLDQALGGRYHVRESDHLLLFAPHDFGHSASLLTFAEAGCDAVVNALGQLAGEGWLGPLVVLLFADAESYVDYATKVGGYVPSRGFCVRNGYAHIVIHPGPLAAVQQTLLHELAHAFLSHLTLPIWLEEGVAQLAEETMFPAWDRSTLGVSAVNESRAYWQNNGLGNFWWGAGFSAKGEEQTHSYQLALMLFRFLVADHKRVLPDFIRHAHHADAGDSAARDFLGEGVAKLAAQFLGPGRWDPIPPDAATFFERGCLLLERGQHAAAIADFDASIALDSLYSDSYANRGEARYRAGDYAAAIFDYEKAIELNPKDFYALSNLAWLQATCPDGKHRDGKQAVKHADRACTACDFKVWFCVDVLAAAYAEVGEFEEAITFGKESLRLAPKEEQSGGRERLQLYREGKPYRESFKSAASD